MSRHTLEHDPGSYFSVDVVGQGNKTIGGHGGRFGISADSAGITDSVTHCHVRHPVSHGGHRAGALYTRRTRQVDGVQAFAVVSVNVIEADRLQAHASLAVFRR